MAARFGSGSNIDSSKADDAIAKANSLVELAFLVPGRLRVQDL